MDKILQKALYTILISLGLAFVFNYLFFGKTIGISVFIFTLVLLGSVFAFGKSQKILLKNSAWLAGGALFFSLMVGIRASDFLTFLNIVATFGLLMLLTYELIGTPVFLMKLRDYITLAILVPFRMAERAFFTAKKLGQMHSAVEKRDTWIRIVKGALMAVPILLIFGALFAQADLAFSQFINNFIDINISERTLQYLALLAFAFIASLGFLSYIFFPRPVIPNLAKATSGELVSTSESANAGRPESSSVHSGRNIEVLVFLSLITTLFLLFIGFQVTYLFGGESNIINAGFTYAEYARRGFFELLAVSVLSLLLLLASEQYTGSETKKDARFLVPSLILITEVVVVIVSAFKRLSLYIDAYGQTLLRFYVAGFIMLLLVLFILLAFKFIQAKQEHFFTFGALLSVLTFLAVINLVNPDAYVIKANLEQFSRTGKVDALYTQDLSADAMSGKLDLYSKLQGEDKQVMYDLLVTQRIGLENQSRHWQSFNFPRSKALKMLQNL